ncbi:shikimate dehydrogenase [Priestia aryabhattai]|uniref:shikimate dehydrogenase n=1 Tax=Priestia megaterium TaxID=1404 RepID=UPI0039B8F939
MSTLYGLVGYPLGHSLSPLMQNDAFKRLNMDAYYEAFPIEPVHFESAIGQLKDKNIQGFNVTIPYKVDIMNHLDEVDPLAKAIGAVNTVVNQDGRYIGYNTDGEGYVTSLLKAVEGGLSKKRILIIGAGGAAKAIFYTIAAQHNPDVITICNRTVEKAAVLANELPFSTKTEAMSISDAEKQLDTFDIIINTTSVGMYPNVDELPLALTLLQKAAVVSDIIYNPLKTKLLKEAEAKGAGTHNGVGMFVLQGALAFEKWTNVRPDEEAMEHIVLSTLTKR